MNSTQISRKSLRDEVPIGQVDIRSSEKTKEVPRVSEEYKQDVLTRQAIDEIKDNMDMFKMDINKSINDLRNEQEKIELGEIKNEIKILQEGI